MKILFLGRDMSSYKGALYQQDFLSTLTAQATVAVYGPGTPGYATQNSMRQVMAELGVPDVVVVSHSWLADEKGVDVDPHPRLRLNEIDVPTILILNKEYVNLDEKLDWARRNNVRMFFSHYDGAEHLGKDFGLKGVYWPLAVSSDALDYLNAGFRQWDLGFSGILKNPHHAGVQDDFRVHVAREIFLKQNNFFRVARKEAAHWKIFWNIAPTSKFDQIMAKLGHGYKHLTKEQYYETLSQAKFWLNSPSPLGIVSTRFFECMLLGAVVVSPQFDSLEQLFRDGEHYVSCRPDGSDFIQVIANMMESPSLVEEIRQNAHEEVVKRHTWGIRVEEFLQAVSAEIGVNDDRGTSWKI